MGTLDAARRDEFDSAGRITDENDEDALSQCRVQISQNVVVVMVIRCVTEGFSVILCRHFGKDLSLVLT